MTERKQSQGPVRRNARLGAALRANLKRRKAQARGRAASSPRPEDGSEPKLKTHEENP